MRNHKQRFHNGAVYCTCGYMWVIEDYMDDSVYLVYYPELDDTTESEG